MNVAADQPARASGVYRPDIDGLRAVAVLAVIAYHAFPGRLPGGFCGVDVFFVISGYLITGIILRERDAGRFSLAGFYARRVRRIFPALAAMLCMCFVIGHLMLLPSELQSLGQSGLASVAFVQNFSLYFSTNYFARTTEQLPLVHLWSLAVEEQFYIVFPLLLVWLTASASRRRRLPLVVSALVAVSFLANVAVSGGDRRADFYLPWHRGWELLAGSLLATWPATVSGRPSSSLRQAASVCGAVMLGGSFVYLDSRGPWPGWRAALPVVATVLLVAAGPGSWCNRHILSNRLAIGIGLVSYPLYLFHWPLLAFAHIRDGSRIAAPLVAVILTATAALAVVTYLLVERPVRRSRSQCVTVGLSLFLASLGALGLVAACGGLPVANDSPCVRQVAAAMADSTWPKIGLATSPVPGMRWIAERISDEEHRTVLAAVRPDPHGFRLGGTDQTTVFYGDSMAAAHVPRLAQLLPDAGPAGRGALVIAAGGACPIPGVSDPSLRRIPTYAKLRHAIDTDPTIDRVVIMASWRFYFLQWSGFSIDGLRLADDAGRRRALAALDDMVGDLVARGKRVTITLLYPSHPNLSPEAFLKRGFRRIACITPPPLPRTELFEQHPVLVEVCEAVVAIAGRHGADVVDPLAFLTADGRCIAGNEDGPIRNDTIHLRASFVREHATFLDDTVAP